MKKSNAKTDKKNNTAQTKKDSIKAFIKNKIFIIFVISLLIEIFVCNYKHFDLEIPHNNVIEVNKYDISVSNVDYEGNGVYRKRNENPKLLISNIDSEVKSVYLDIGRNNNYNIDIKIGVRDTASNNFWYYEDTSIIKSIENSKYLKLNTAGTVQEMSVEFKNLENDEIFEVNNITFNLVRPFRFIFLRFLLIFLFLFILYTIRPSSPSYEIMYTGEKWQKTVLWTIMAVSALFIVFTAVTTSGKEGNNFNRSMYNDAVQSWVDGDVSLPYSVSDELRELDNPYDKSMRDRNSVGYTWDAAYYNGKYYMYFGVIPLLILYYPLKLIFNCDLNSYVAVMIFALLSLFGAYSIMEGMNKRWLRNKVPFFVYAMCLTLIIFTSGIYYFCRRPYFYEVAQISALTFGMLGLGSWLNAVDENGVINKKILCLGSVFMAFTVGCRPNYALYSFVFIPLFWDSIFKKLKKLDKNMVKTIACVALPYVIMAAGLMYYNYIRFDSPFDFGNNYQLTIYDMRYSGDIGKIPLGIWTMYLQPPHIVNTFPFVPEIYPSISYQGQVYLSHEICGLFFADVITIYIFKVKMLRDKHKGTGMFSFALAFILISVIQSFVIFRTSGMLYRYIYDFTWCFVVAAVLIACVIISDNTDKSHYRIHIKLFSICFVLCMLFNILVSLRGENDSFRGNWPSLYYAIERAVAFWL